MISWSYRGATSSPDSDLERMMPWMLVVVTFSRDLVMIVT